MYLICLLVIFKVQVVTISSGRDNFLLVDNMNFLRLNLKRDVQDVVMQICLSYHVIIFSSFHSKLAAYAERNRERILRIHLHQLHQLHLHGLLRTRSEFQTQPQNTPQRYQSQLPRQMV